MTMFMFSKFYISTVLFHENVNYKQKGHDERLTVIGPISFILSEDNCPITLLRENIVHSVGYFSMF